jgi:hypothetical protein
MHEEHVTKVNPTEEDVMRIQTKFFKSIISKAVEKAVLEKVGCATDIRVNDLFLSHKDDLTSLSLNVSLNLNDKELGELVGKLL